MVEHLDKKIIMQCIDTAIYTVTLIMSTVKLHKICIFSFLKFFTCYHIVASHLRNLNRLLKNLENSHFLKLLCLHVRE